MHLRNDSIALGTPRFRDPELAREEREQGVLAAWRSALLRGPCEAAAGAAGDFAIALQEASGRTFLAVDRFAIHTLCYRVDGDGLRFAPRADHLADSATELDPQAIYDYLFFHSIPSPRTIFKGVHRLPPAHCAVF